MRIEDDPNLTPLPPWPPLPNGLPYLQREMTMSGSRLTKTSIKLENPRVVMAPVPAPLPYELKWDLYVKNIRAREERNRVLEKTTAPLPPAFRDRI